MVHSNAAGPQAHRIVVTPDRSASWHSNRRLLIALGLWLALVALVFAAAGLWLVLPFAGFELAALALALLHTSRRLQRQQTLYISAEVVVIEKRCHGSTHRWQLLRREAALAVVQHHPHAPLELLVFTASVAVPVGEFLGHGDSRRLLGALRSTGLPVRSHGPVGHLQI